MPQGRLHQTYWFRLRRIRRHRAGCGGTGSEESLCAEIMTEVAVIYEVQVHWHADTQTNVLRVVLEVGQSDRDCRDIMPLHRLGPDRHRRGRGGERQEQNRPYVPRATHGAGGAIGLSLLAQSSGMTGYRSAA